jgi:bacterioferritin-associated ferredoxin
MYVCICKAVTAATVKQVIDQGASTPEEVERRCRAGGDCGACHETICNMIEDQHGRDRRRCEVHSLPVLAA